MSDTTPGPYDQDQPTPEPTPEPPPEAQTHDPLEGAPPDAAATDQDSQP